MNVGPGIRDALISDVEIISLITQWEGAPSVHNRRPLPADVQYPCIGVSPDIVNVDRDLVNARSQLIVRDVTVYGQQPNDYRDVEQVGRLIFTLFHRNRFSISVDGFRVIEIIASGPIPGPVDDENIVARVVSLSIRLQPTS